MTEQEIVNILKENKTKGIAYLFLPEEVWEWIGENLNNPKLLYLATNGQWRLFSETDFDDFDNIVFALPDYFQIKKEQKGKWVEFEIDDDGDFSYLAESEKDEHCKSYYSWYSWERFLEDSKENERGFTAFGGWRYEYDKRWYMAPTTKLNTDNYYWNSYISEKEDVKPAIPVQIRFWRESK